MSDFDELRARLKQLSLAEPGPKMYGWADRWYDDYHVRCVNNHVSTSILSSEIRGPVCLACQEPVCLTFPEDIDGVPLEDSIMALKIVAPWTDDQVESLNAYQVAGVFHPFTCPNDDLHGLQATLLVAEPDGWRCSVVECDYRQNWAHEWMTNNFWRALNNSF